MAPKPCATAFSVARVPVLLNRFLSRAHFGRSLQSLQNHLPRPEAPPIDQLQAPALALGRIKLFVDAKLCGTKHQLSRSALSALQQQSTLRVFKSVISLHHLSIRVVARLFHDPSLSHAKSRPRIMASARRRRVARRRLQPPAHSPAILLVRREHQRRPGRGVDELNVRLTSQRVQGRVRRRHRVEIERFASLVESRPFPFCANRHRARSRCALEGDARAFGSVYSKFSTRARSRGMSNARVRVRARDRVATRRCFGTALEAKISSQRRGARRRSAGEARRRRAWRRPIRDERTVSARAWRWRGILETPRRDARRSARHAVGFAVADRRRRPIRCR